MTEIACVVEAHDALGECCLWCPITRRVWWLDILKPCLQCFDPVRREHQVYPLPGRLCGCVVPRQSGGFVLATENGLHGFDPSNIWLQYLLHVEPNEPGNRYNDGRCDRRGRLWIGTMDVELRRPSGTFYRIGPDRSVARAVRQHHGAELDLLFARRPHALFRRHAASCHLGLRLRHRCRHDQQPPGVRRPDRPQGPARRLLRRRARAICGTPNTPAAG